VTNITTDQIYELLFNEKVEYAMEAISQAGAAVGMKTRSGVTIAAERRILSKVQICIKQPIYFDKSLFFKAPRKQ
jgi:20S proteasome alpha/beta subunit